MITDETIYFAQTQLTLSLFKKRDRPALALSLGLAVGFFGG